MKTPQHKLESYKRAQKKWKAKRPYYNKEHYRQNPETYKARATRWYKKNREKMCEYSRLHRKKGFSEAGKRWQAEHPSYNKENREKVKLEVLIRYSEEEIKCKKCGFNDIDCLAIDHINNDGSKDRKIRHTGYNMYCWLKRNNYPKGFQVLCCNCNWKKHKVNLKELSK